MSDTTPPTITSFSLTPVVDVSSGKGILELSMTASDTESEIDQAVISFFSPSLSYGFTANSTAPNLTSHSILLSGVYDSWTDGQSVEQKSLFDGQTPGVYSINYITIEDSFGNKKTYDGNDLASAGFSSSFELINSSVTDLTGTTGNDTLTILTNTAVFSGDYADYTFSQSDSYVSILTNNTTNKVVSLYVDYKGEGRWKAL
jgi:hypothetical protein